MALSAAVSEVLEEPLPVVRRIQESDLTKEEVKKVVRSMLKSELPDFLVSQLKKSEEVESIVSSITARVLAQFFEIMWTRKNTWQAQLKKSK